MNLFPLPHKPARLFVLSLLVILPSCATMTTTAAPTSDKVTCTALRQLSWSRKDTDQTIAEIKEDNAAKKAICPAPKPRPAKAAGITFKDRWHEGVRTVATVFR
jgi:hypothetical protein